MDAPKQPPYTAADRNFMRKIEHDFSVIGEQMSHAAARLTVALNVSTARMRRTIEAMLGMNAELQRQFLANRRAALGGNGSDAFSDQWQSAACGAWLHTSCPDGAGHLHCTCRCHAAA
jgi:hypothetical protein